MLPAVLTGLLFGLSLIVAIGPQNAFVIRQGAVRQHVTPVFAICSLSDVVLIAAGVAGAGAALSGSATALTVVRIGGAAALLAYAALAARRAIAGPGGDGDGDGRAGAPSSSRRAVIAATLAFTWANPAVYLDTIVLLGSVANTQHGERWAFGLGAAAGSVVWFAALGYGAALLAPLLRSPWAWRALDGFVAVVMAVTAARLLAGL